MKWSEARFRWGWLGAVLGGLTYILLNVLIEIFFPDHWSGSGTTLVSFDYTEFSRVLWLPTALLLSGLGGAYQHQSSWLGRLGKSGFLLAAAGFSLHILGNIIEFSLFGLLFVPSAGSFQTGSAGSQLGYNISGYGTILQLAGLLLLGVGSLRSTGPRIWRWAMFAIGLIYAMVLPFYFGGPLLLMVHTVAYGTAWIILGYLLWKEKPGTRASPSQG